LEPAVLLLVLGLLVCLPSVLCVDEMEVSTEMGDLLAGDQRNLESYEGAQGILGDTEPLAVSLDCGEVYSAEGVALIRRVTAALGTLPGVTVTNQVFRDGLYHEVVRTNVNSLVTVERPVRDGLGLKWLPLVPERLDENGLRELRRWSQEHPFARNILVAADGRHTMLIINLTEPAFTTEEQLLFHNQVEAVLQPFRDEGHSARAIALPLIEHEIYTTLVQDTRRFVPLAMALLVGVLLVTFRRLPRLMIFVLVSQAMGLALLPLLMEVTGLYLNIFTVLLLPLLTGVHLTLLIHVATAFQRAWARGLGAVEAIHAMLAEVFRASAYAALTTMVGLLALMASEVQQIREFGQLGAAGIGMLFLVTFGPALGLLLVLFRNAKSPVPEATVAEIETVQGSGWLDFLLRHRRGIAAAAVVAVGVMALGISKVRTDIRASEFLGNESPTRKMIEELDAAYGGINVVRMAVDSGMTNGINHPKFLKCLDAVHQHAAAQEEVTAVYSYAQLLATINEVWEGGAEGTRVLPESVFKIAMFVAVLNKERVGDTHTPFMEMLSDRRGQTAQLLLRTRDMSSAAYLDLLRRMETHARTNAPAGVTVSIESGVRAILEADRRIVRSQRRSVLWSIGLIALLLAVLWRSVGLAVLALAVNVLPVGMLIALQGFAGVPLNSITIMVAAIALGIAVDDTIHFITHWRGERAAGMDAKEAVRRTLAVKGRPIVATTAILVGMAGVFWVSQFPPVVHFGLLLAAGLAGALVAALGLLPAWLGRNAGKMGDTGK
jgi:predicted RND superfamily exporter protein